MSNDVGPIFIYSLSKTVKVTHNKYVKQQTKIDMIKAVAAALCIVLAALCAVFMASRDKTVYIVTILLCGLSAAVYGAVDGDKHSHVSRTVFVGIAVLAIFVVGYILYYETGLSDKLSDFETIKAYIRGSGFWGVAIFIALTVFQVVVLPIPGAVTILLGVAIYGATWSFVLSTIGTMIGSLIAFALGKVFGRRLCNWMFGEENTNKYARLLCEKGKFLFIIMLLFPAFPDDMLCTIAGVTSMSYLYFTVVCLLTRPVMIGFTAYLGSGAIPFSGWGIPVWIALGCLMYVVFVVISKIKTKIESRKSN